MEGWQIDTGKVDVGRLSRNYNLPYAGASMLHLCAEGRGSIEQAISTEEGVTYQLSFSYAANPENSAEQGVEVGLSWDGADSVRTTVVGKPQRSCNRGRHNKYSCWGWNYLAWHRHFVKFKAEATTTTLQFTSTVNGSACMVLDDVWVALPPFRNLPDTYMFFRDFQTKCWFEPPNQGKCGSCWAFAAVGALEKQYCMRARGLSKPSLSREMMVRCSARNYGCSGGNADTAYGDLMEIGGLWQTKCLPYQGLGAKHCPAFAYSWSDQLAAGKTGRFARIDQEMQSKCDDLRRFSNRPPIGLEWDLPFTMIYSQRTGHAPDYGDDQLLTYRRYFAKARSHDNVPSWWLYGEDAMMAAIAKYGAIYASFTVRMDFSPLPPVDRICFDHCWPNSQIYGEDGYQASCGTPEGHAIQIIGYATETLESGEEIRYWQIENSWGTTVHQDLFGGEPGDPFTYGHPEDAEDKCLLVFGVETAGAGDGWELLLWLDGTHVAKKDVTLEEGKQILQYTLDISPGPHALTFEIHAKEHKKELGIDNEEYTIFMPMMRCRGRGYRLDFLKDIKTVQLSWNKPTRAELVKQADELLSANGIDPNTLVEGCPEQCTKGRFSTTHPCTGMLSELGTCIEVAVPGLQTTHNCTACDRVKAKIEAKAELIHRLPSAVFKRWYFLIHEALTAPDEPGWNRKGALCVVQTAGHAPFSRLNATYPFILPQRAECDVRNTAMVKPTTHTSFKVFVRPDAPIANGQSRTVACPDPLGGTATLECNGGVLRVRRHSCAAQNGMDITKRGYYRMLRGANYHGIESGAAFAIAELGVSSEICPTTSWSRWSLCNATAVCEKGMQTRSREPRAPLDKNSPQCSGIAFVESRPCMRPGFCPQILARFRTGHSRDIQDFLSGYPSAATALPAPRAGAHMLSSFYTPCSDLMHWCGVVTGKRSCTVLFQAQFEVRKAGQYLLEFSGSGLSGNSEVIFSPLRGRKAAEQAHYRTKFNKDMEVFMDKGEVHRRRRAGKGGSEWRRAGAVQFDGGYYSAWVLLTGWTHCPRYIIKLHNLEAYSPATLYGKSRQSTDRDFGQKGPWIEVTQGGSRLRQKIWGKNWTWTAAQMYRTLGVNQYDAALSSKNMKIVGETVLPGAGLYKIEVRMDVACRNDMQWKYCPRQEPSHRRRRGGSISLQVRDPELQQWHQHAYRNENTNDNVVVHLVINASGRSPIEVIVQTEVKSADAGRRIRVGNAGGQPLHETVPVPSHYTLPNTIEVVWAKCELAGTGSPYHDDPQAVDLFSEIRYQGEVDLIRGDGLTRVTWPDRDMPFDSEYQIQPFNATPTGVILLGSREVTGFLAEAEGRVDAGACISLVAEAGHSHEAAVNGTLRGFGLDLCDVDGDRQYLELFTLLHGGEGKEKSGWTHVEFTHPTHLRIMRDIANRKLDIGFRPDNRVHYARVWEGFQERFHIHDSFWSTPLTVGVSMGTERPYRWSEFYNISINECPTTCTGLKGGRLFCGGRITTPCGNTVDCSAPCDQGDTCIDGHCFTCPAQTAEHAGWVCGTREVVCTDHEGHQFEKSIPVGRGCDELFECGVDHTCHCQPETVFSYRALGYECGELPDNCGQNVDLGECAYLGNENAVCANNHCTCTAIDYTSAGTVAITEGWNCGRAANGCGEDITFGDSGGACPEGKLCVGHVCCEPEAFPDSYECGSEYDVCRRQNITFTKAQEQWELVFRQTKPNSWPDWSWRPRGAPTDPNYASRWAHDWGRRSVLTQYLDADDKLTFKLVYTGSSLPLQKPYNIWKQTAFPTTQSCSGSRMEGFVPVEINLDSDDFSGLCKSNSGENLLDGHASARRRRVQGGAKIVIGQKIPPPAGGISTPMVGDAKADAVELYLKSYRRKDGSCPHGTCSEEHRCVCTPATVPTGAECGQFDTGCGEIRSFNYTGPHGVAAPGLCPTGRLCNPSTLKCEVVQRVPFASIDQLRRCLASDVTRISQRLSKIFPFTHGSSGNRIIDGGNNMYGRSGNEIRVRASGRWSWTLSYSDRCDEGWNSAGTGDVQYFTCKITSPVTVWFAGFKSQSESIDGFQTSGRLGAGGRGTATSASTQEWPYGELWGYYRQVYGTSAPSVNQVVLLPSPAWTNRPEPNTRLGYQRVTGTQKVGFVLYVLFAGHDANRHPSGVQYTPLDFDGILASITQSC